MDDQGRLTGYVDVWWRAIDDFTHLLESLADDQWSAPTDLPGWDVHAVAAHTAHLESVLAGHSEDPLDFEPPGHVTTLQGHYTESGVRARRDHTPDEIINEIRESATTRRTALLADPPTDPAGQPPFTPGGVGWNWQTLLRNRPLDVWFHEQDIRRAVGLATTPESEAAQHTADYLTESLGYVVGKRAAAPAGATVVLEVAGSTPVTVEVDESGRGQRVEGVGSPTVRLATDRESFLMVAGGRDASYAERWQVTGDDELGRRIIDAFTGVTP